MEVSFQRGNRRKCKFHLKISLCTKKWRKKFKLMKSQRLNYSWKFWKFSWIKLKCRLANCLTLNVIFVTFVCSKNSKWLFYTKQVAWVRVDTQTILSIHHNVITQNPRIILTHNDHRSWYLHIREVEEADRGWYMCQVRTHPI